MKEEINMTQTFYITYWAEKHKKHITRRGKHDDKSRFGTNKKGKDYYVYYDIDASLQLQKPQYRTASGSWKVRY